MYGVGFELCEIVFRGFTQLCMQREKGVEAFILLKIMHDILVLQYFQVGS